MRAPTALAAMAGGFSVQLHDPGPRFACGVLETEPTVFAGLLHEGGGGCTVVPTDAQELPARVPAAALPPVDSDATTNEDYEASLGVPVRNPASAHKHVLDGAFTGWSAVL